MGSLYRRHTRLNVWEIPETYIDAVCEDDAIDQAEEYFFTAFEESFENRADGIEGESLRAAEQGGVR